MGKTIQKAFGKIVELDIPVERRVRWKENGRCDSQRLWTHSQRGNEVSGQMHWSIPSRTLNTVLLISGCSALF